MSSPFPSAGGAGKYSGKNNFRAVNFICQAPTAKSVCLAGEFNDWNPTSHRLQQQPDGNWTGQFDLSHGHHLYVFIVDGKPVLDPRAQGVSRNAKNERVSLILVS